MFQDNPPVDGPSVDKDADLTDSGELKDLVEEVKEDAPTDQPPPEAQIRPDNEANTPDSLNPNLNPPTEEPDADTPKEEYPVSGSQPDSWLHFEEEKTDEL